MGPTALRFRLAVAAAAVLAATIQRGGGPSAASAQTPQEVVRLLTALPGGGFRPLAEDLVSVYRRSLPDVSFETAPGLSAEASLESIQQGGADLSFAFADQAYVAFIGRPRSGITPDDRLRAIANLGVTPLQFVVRKGSRIRSVRDLRGATVGVGAPGSGTELTVEMLLESYGLPASSIHAEHLSLVEAARGIANGTLDAMFSDTIYPAAGITLATTGGGQLIPLTGPPIDHLRRLYQFFKPARLPRTAYPGMHEDVVTIGVDSLLVCRRDLDEELVYQLTKTFFDALPTLSSARTALRFMDADQAAAAPIPLHDGAARYYRERELLR
jgi:TRAP transporter TAXI family solute receptor